MTPTFRVTFKKHEADMYGDMVIWVNEHFRADDPHGAYRRMTPTVCMSEDDTKLIAGGLQAEFIKL